MLATYLVTSSVLGPKETAGTLLWAIDRANSSPDVPDKIRFNAGLQVVVPGDSDFPQGLPLLLGPTTITGNNAELRGSGQSRPWYGLRINNTDGYGIGPVTINNLRITGFQFAGIYVERLLGSSEITISGSTIHGNFGHGIWSESTRKVTITGNSIYSNTWNGISVNLPIAGTSATGNAITNNSIGVAGGNGQHGIYLGPNVSDFTVTSNSIANNGGTNSSYDGVALAHGAGVRNRLSNNTFIMTNGGIPIDLGEGGPNGGPTMNDQFDDSDSGPNDLLNYPDNISFTLSGSTSTVSGVLDLPTALTGQQAIVELYKYTATTKEYRRVATTTVTLLANGNASWSISLPNGSGAGEIQSGGEVAALTIHHQSGNTSEMSSRVIVGQPAIDLLIAGGDNFRGISGDLHLEYTISGPPGSHASPFYIGICRVSVQTGVEIFMFRHLVSDEPFLRAQSNQHGRYIPVPADFDTNDAVEDYYLRAKLDDLNSNPEPNEQNNVAIYGGGVYRSPAALHAMGSWRAEGNRTFTITESAGTMTATMAGLEGFGYSGGTVPVYVRSGTGNDIINATALTQPITIWGGNGDDTLNIDGVATMPAALSGFDPGAGNNVFNVNSGKVYLDTPWSGVTDALAALATTVKGGAELQTNRLWQTSVSIIEGAKVTLVQDNSFANPPSKLNALTIDTQSGSKLDINDQALIIDYTGTSPLADIRSYILSGRGGSGFSPSWNGAGIASTTGFTATNPLSVSIGYAENSALPLGAYTSFRGVAVDSTSILIAYTRTGDTNLDGYVNDDDVTVVGAFYAPGVPNPDWFKGDFDLNGFVDDNDVTLLGAFYNPSAPPV